MPEDMVEEHKAVGWLTGPILPRKVKNKPGETLYVLWGEDQTEADCQEMSVKGQMQEGLDNEEFVIYMQPKIGEQGRHCKSCGGTGEMGSSRRGCFRRFFIPVLEKNHLSGKVDRYVFKKVYLVPWFCMERAGAGSVNVENPVLQPSFIPVYS